MLEATVSAAAWAALAGVGLVLWRLAAGRARRRLYLALRIATLTLATGALIIVSVWGLSKSRTFQLFGDLVQRVDVTQPVLALTFDDGPSSEYTSEILAILAEQDVHATFYLTGQAMEANPRAAQELVAAGHELGNHSYTHQHMLLRSLSFVQDEIERTDAAIREAGYTGQITFRPPYGKRFILLPLVLERTKRITVLFDVEPESYPDVAADANLIQAHVLDHARSGSIILLHVMAPPRDETREALPGVIAGLRARGYQFVTVSELLSLR